MIVRIATLYKVECWVMNQAHEKKIRVTQMGMLKWICGHIRIYKIRNDNIK